MNKLKLFPLFFLLLGCFMTVKAQDEIPNPPQSANQPKRPGLLAQLGLTREQVQQIRQINQDNRPQMREANQRLREANRNLDLAVYGDKIEDTEVENRLQAVNAARAEVVRLRTETEFAVRKILTPDQLVKFREIRRRMMSEKEVLPRLRNNRQQMNNLNRIQNNPRRPNRVVN